MKRYDDHEHTFRSSKETNEWDRVMEIRAGIN